MMGMLVLSAQERAPAHLGGRPKGLRGARCVRNRAASRILP